MKTIFRLILVTIFYSLFSCQKQKEVVVYCTVDQVFSEPVLQNFEKETGIQVRPVFDTEETKSTGVMNRLIAEKNNPQCDVFWSGDPIRNNVLKNKKITTAYRSKSGAQIPEYFRDSSYHWTGFSARARVLIYNKKLLSKEAVPTSIFDFTKPEYKGKFAIANPLFGTTTFHIAALFSVVGKQKAQEWLTGIKQNNVVLASSNGDVKKRVIRGEIAFGLTDTDDAFEATHETDDVAYLFPDQGIDEIGTLIMPNALSLIKNSPNPENARKLFEYLISKKTEAKLAESCAQMPLIKGTKTPLNIPSLDSIKPMKINYAKTAKLLESIQADLKKWVENQ